ncbi:MAG: hypothetical protein ACK5Y2_11920 [Bdellovibrionales bacterium]
MKLSLLFVSMILFCISSAFSADLDDPRFICKNGNLPRDLRGVYEKKRPSGTLRIELTATKFIMSDSVFTHTSELRSCQRSGRRVITIWKDKISPPGQQDVSNYTVERLPSKDLLLFDLERRKETLLTFKFARIVAICKRGSLPPLYHGLYIDSETNQPCQLDADSLLAKFEEIPEPVRFGLTSCQRNGSQFFTLWFTGFDPSAPKAVANYKIQKVPNGDLQLFHIESGELGTLKPKN